MTARSVPSPMTWVDKDEPTYDVMNRELRDTWDFLLNPPMVKLRQTVAQNLPNAAWTVLTWDVEDVDTDGFHSSTLPTRIKPTVPGWYRGYFGVSFKQANSALDTTGMRGGALMMNGGGTTTLGWRSYAMNGGLSGADIILKGNAFGPIRFNGTTDYVEVYAFHTAGGTLTTDIGLGDTDYEKSPEFGMRWVSKL